MTTQADILGELDLRLEQAVTLTVGRMANDEIRAQHVVLDVGAADGFRDLCRVTRQRIAENRPVPYAATTEIAEDEFCLIDDTKTLNELIAFRDLARHVTTMHQMAPSSLDNRIELYAVVFGDDADTTNRILFARKANPRIRHKAGRIFAVLGERLTRIEEPEFSFEPDIDFVIGANWAVVLNQKRFETLLRSIGVVEQRVDSWISGITDYLPMGEESIRTLREVALRDSRTWRRLRDIEHRRHLANVTLVQVEEYASLVGLDPKNIVVNDELVFNPAERFGFLHLLNEDLYNGFLTGESFESQRKTMVT